jgi:hypothetical protein
MEEPLIRGEAVETEEDGVMPPTPPAPVAALAPGEPTGGMLGSRDRADVGVGGDEDTAPVSWLVRVEICIGPSLKSYTFITRGEWVKRECRARPG